MALHFDQSDQRPQCPSIAEPIEKNEKNYVTVCSHISSTIIRCMQTCRNSAGPVLLVLRMQCTLVDQDSSTKSTVTRSRLTPDGMGLITNKTALKQYFFLKALCLIPTEPKLRRE